MDPATPATPWFRPKPVGYGAYPVTWQGWLVVGAFLAGLALAAILLLALPAARPDGMPLVNFFIFLKIVLVLLIGLVAVARAKSSGLGGLRGRAEGR
jgi:hypothetical protein